MSANAALDTANIAATPMATVRDGLLAAPMMSSLVSLRSLAVRLAHTRAEVSCDGVSTDRRPTMNYHRPASRKGASDEADMRLGMLPGPRRGARHTRRRANLAGAPDHHRRAVRGRRRQ